MMTTTPAATTLRRTSSALITEIWGLVGVEEAIEKLSTCQLPALSMTNGLIITGGLTAVALTAAEAFSSDVQNSPSALAITGLNLFFSGGAQFVEYYNLHKRIQELQHGFIRAIPISYIARCYYRSVNNTVEMTAAITAENIIGFLARYTYATIELTIPNISFTLRNNGFCSMRLGGAAVASLSASVASTAIFVSYGLAKQAFETTTPAPTIPSDFAPTSSPTEAVTMDNDTVILQAAAAVSTMPILKFWSALVDSCYQQRLNLLRSMSQVARALYSGYANFDSFPTPFLSLFEDYISKEDMIKNREKINRLKEEKANSRIIDLEANSRKVIDLERKVKTLEDTVEELKAKAQEEEEETNPLLKPKLSI